MTIVACRTAVRDPSFGGRLLAEGNGPVLVALRAAGVADGTIEGLLQTIREVELNRDAAARQLVVQGLRTVGLFDRAVEQVAATLASNPQLGSLTPPRGAAARGREEASAALVGAIKEVSAQVQSPGSPKKATNHRLLTGLGARGAPQSPVSALLAVSSAMFSQDEMMDAILRRTLNGIEEEGTQGGGLVVTAELLRTAKRARLEEMAQGIMAGCLPHLVQEGAVSQEEAARRVDRALQRATEDVKCDGSMYCLECRLWFPGNHTPNRKHCWSCNKCVTGFDHHCKYLNQCVGEANYSVWAGFIASLNIATVSQIGFGIYALIQFWTTGSTIGTRARDIWGETLFLTLTFLMLVVDLVIMIAVGDLARLHHVLAYKNWRLNVEMADLQRGLMASRSDSDSNERSRQVKLFAERGLGYITTYTYNRQQYDNKRQLVKIADKMNQLMLMRAETAREKLKWCMKAWLQNSTETSRQKAAEESEALFAASPMTFFQGTDIGGQGDFERLMGSSEMRTRSATDPTTSGGARYNRMEEKEGAPEPRRSLHLYATAGYSAERSAALGRTRSQQEPVMGFRFSHPGFLQSDGGERPEPMGMGTRLLPPGGRISEASSTDTAELYFAHGEP